MNHASFFSGIGAPEIAAEWLGWNNVLHCEINPFSQKILKYYWPHATSYADITQTDFTPYRGLIDVLSGGFPCQPYSVAGKRLGKEDERHLWPHMLRGIQEIRPRYVVGENVRGIVSWNEGLVFDEVCADLEAEGYEVLPFILPACAVNAPHRRERVWFVAYAIGRGRHARPPEQIRQEISVGEEFGDNGECRDVTDTASVKLQGRGEQGILRKERPESQQRFADMGSFSSWQNFPTQSPICSGNDGISAQLDGITFSKWRNESIKAFGNSMVPQVIYQIFKAIDIHNLIR